MNDDARLGRGVHGDRIDRAGVTEVHAERHIDDIDTGASRTLDGVLNEIRCAFAAEDLQRVELGLGRNAGADPEISAAHGIRGVRAGVGLAVGQDAVACRDAGHVIAMIVGRRVSLAVERVRIGVRRLRGATGARVVGVADKVISAHDLGRRERSLLDNSRVVVLPTGVARPTVVGVVVVDPGVDDGNGHALAGDAVIRPRLDGTDVLVRNKILPLDARDGVQLGDARDVRDQRGLPRGCQDAKPVEDIGERRLNRSANRRDSRADAALLLGDLCTNRLLSTVGKLRAVRRKAGRLV